MRTEMKNCLGVAVASLLMAGHASVAVAQSKIEAQTTSTMTEEVKVLKPVYTAPKGKEVYIPKDLKDNDFSSSDSKWSFARCAYTDDIIVFWEKPFGNDLSQAPDLEGHNMKVDLRNLMGRLQSFYDYFKNELKFIKPGSNADRYRMMVMLNYSLEGTAYGGDYDGMIGALWIAPNRVQDKKLNCIAHELGHSFQSMIACDKQGESWGGGGIFEMTSQWMLFNVNPEWPTDENYHWKAFIDHANLRFLAGENIYHSPYLLEYWSMKRGMTVMGDLFRNGKRGEDPASTYMRMFGLSNEEFAKEAVDCYSRLLTFDFPGKHEANKKYAGEFVNRKPLETFGANVIRLNTAGKKSVKVKFEGGSKTDGYAYRLVAVSNDGKATYGDIMTKQKGTTKLALPADTKEAYFVVTGYPLGAYEPYTFNPYSQEKPKEEHVYTYSIE
jgi:hypothetical protein